VSLRDLDRLMKLAIENEWSAEGRPEWLARNRDRFSEAFLVVFGVEAPSVYRCVTSVILDDRSGWNSTLDVAFAEYNRLPDLGSTSVTVLAHRYLSGLPQIELDQGQQEAWRRLGYPKLD